MVQVPGWVTTLVLGFGIVVAVIGVIAYLRMFRKDRLSSHSHQAADVSPPNVITPVKPTDSGHIKEAKPEQAMPRD
ncbi:hypothetical protein BK133_14305 [Paenibacillus sp. FSL H8-0548]|uniref:hypothetical protein n=1 Tax=Paenibacillus sp. FSL H8-0548 TaxID=1920422 RepID=UPI00096D5DAE|nr:hypothetical protein [Paenibacillus sp. FSL H8-0548]OMF32665.1 hypothetical protein BK133_14305 [Paenibacillus sp. FSL H8-0548]